MVISELSGHKSKTNKSIKRRDVTLSRRPITFGTDFFEADLRLAFVMAGLTAPTPACDGEEVLEHNILERNYGD